MDMRIRVVVLFVWLFICLSVCSGGARASDAGPVGAPTGPIHEQVWRVPMELPRAKGTVVNLETTVYRPDGNGPFPLILLSHGTPRDAVARKKSPRQRFYEQSRWFVEHGYAVVIPMRRGYADSEGAYAEDSGPCDNRDYANSGLTSANDIGAVLRYFRDQAFIDRNHIILAGQSTGGFASLATASRNPPGVIGVLNFAGGRGSSAPDHVCQEDRLVAAVSRFGQTTKVPSIWFYAQNDHFFGPALSQEMFAAWRTAGAPGEFVRLPAFGNDGHDTFPTWKANANWTGQVKQFLDSLPKR
jgi:dienelactone hydrolase